MRKSDLKTIQCLIDIVKPKEVDLMRYFLLAAIEFGRFDCVNMLHKNYKFDINTCFAENEYKNNFKFTALHCSVRHNQFELTEFLIKQGADINAGFNRSIPDGHEGEAQLKQTPLTIAVLNLRLNFIKMLLEHGAQLQDCNIPGVACFIPYVIQETYRNHERRNFDATLVFLINKGIACDLSNIKFLELLIDFDCIETFKLLLDGVNLKNTAFQGISLLDTAVSRRNIELISLLLQKGVDVNQPIHLVGGTFSVLHRAAQDKDDTEALLTLINNGADINICDDNGVTPLFKAVGAYNIKAAKLLLLHGADPNVLNKKSKTVMETYPYSNECIQVIQEFQKMKEMWEISNWSIVKKVAKILIEQGLTSHKLSLLESKEKQWVGKMEQLIGNKIAKWEKNVEIDLTFLKHDLEEIEILNNKQIDSLTFSLQFLFQQLNHVLVQANYPANSSDFIDEEQILTEFKL